MKWLRQRITELSVLALIVALTALSASFAEIWRSAEWWNVVISALLALSTAFLVCAAFRGLHTWRHEAARKLASSLYSSTLDLVTAMENACRQGESVAKFYLQVMPNHLPLTSGLRAFLIEEAPQRVSRALGDLQKAQSRWETDVDVATASWGDAVKNEAKGLEDLLTVLTERLKILTQDVLFSNSFQLPGRQERSNYENVEKELGEMRELGPEVSQALKQYLIKHLQL